MNGQGAGSAAGGQEAVFAFLARPDTYGHDVSVKRIDTHGAVVFLAGRDVYKVKRAVRYPFMDLSTLEKRHKVCEAEIAVNRVNAPDLYLGVVPIIHGAQGLALGTDGQGEGDVAPGRVLEWAVHMKRFDEEATLDRLAERGALPEDMTARLAEMAVRAHAVAPPVADPQASVAALAGYVRRNAEGIAQRPEIVSVDRVLALKAASLAAHERLRALLTGRARAGFVRRCHGDMHLRNIVLIDGAPVLFDAIEFDESIASIDLLYDLAFLLMDLWARDLQAIANGVLNRYLWARDCDADIAGLAALPLLLSVRAGVRAMVDVAGLQYFEGEQLAQAMEEARGYVELAERFIAPPPPRLIAVGGLSGTGKSTLARHLAPHVPGSAGAVHLRSDIVRKNLSGVGETVRLPPEAYGPDVTEAVYAKLRQLAREALRARQSVIVDAVHAREAERDTLEAIARETGADFAGLWLEAPLGVLEARVTERVGDASDADAGVVRGQARYALGDIRWRRLSTDGAPGDVTARAREALGLD
ncbi:bifunctional aminoglycoside phosphotransferase/ATP-binding protein [Pseudochelatococcus sp. B33]